MLIAPGTVPYGEWHSSLSRPSLYIVMPLPLDLRTTGGVGEVELFMFTVPALEGSGVSLAGMGVGGRCHMVLGPVQMAVVPATVWVLTGTGRLATGVRGTWLSAERPRGGGAAGTHPALCFALVLGSFKSSHLE